MYPIILVVDLDETLIFFDEDNCLKRQCYTLFYRPEIYSFFEYLRAWFRDNIFLVLWSTGENMYVNDILHKLHLNYFDVVYGRTESDKSELEFEARKSIRYLKQNKCVQLFLKKMYVKFEASMYHTKYAIVDDKCDENVDELEPYDFMFPIRPLNLRSIFVERRIRTCSNGQQIIENSLICKTQSLFAFADYLVYNCIVSEDAHGGEIMIRKAASNDREKLTIHKNRKNG
ncbi:hypothetical protein B4U80_13622 [Leptotrombidium deliense]|uniref:FCP1 homology domain-containing protein n=1 Tax=Leptotrombidium deliense TaxID=299467 RepID=A0A443SS93_9ACAR|nr:hypothetical protein B4U80_13622 [Leptotrombidium deliense]